MKARINRFCIVVFGSSVAGTCAGCHGPMDAAAEKVFLASVGKTSITVFPAFVRSGSRPTHDATAAAKVAEFLKTNGLAEALVTDQQVPVAGPGHINQARMWRESAEAFAAHVKAHPITTQYALLPEYLVGKDRTGKDWVIGIHCYVVDNQGTLCFGVLLNSHWREFADANPKTAEECTAVLVKVLQGRLEQNPAGK